MSITGEDTEYLTRNEVSKVLNVTVQTLNNWRREGVLNPLKIGGRVLYRKEDVYITHDWLRELLTEFILGYNKTIIFSKYQNQQKILHFKF